MFDTPASSSRLACAVAALMVSALSLLTVALPVA